MPLDDELIHATIDLTAIDHNLRALRSLTRPPTRMMAVVKANAYGHGALTVAETAVAAGADALGVARVGEAVALRRAGIDAPILVFGHTPAGRAAELIEHDIAGTVHGVEGALALSDAARTLGSRVEVHLKIDTGMGRIGLMAEDTDAARTVLELPGLRPTGIYTHFASADSEDKTFARRQIQRFQDCIGRLSPHFPPETPMVRHAANSAATIDIPEAHFDLVRPGLSLYGLYPSPHQRARVDLRPAMTLVSRIIHLKQVPAGFPVSYGSTYITPEPTAIATVPVGYADGYDRLLSSKGRMLVRGAHAPVVGRVCMDQTMIDVGQIPAAEVGDEVVIIGRRGKAEVSADEIADLTGTINYEVVSTLTARVQRRYIRNEE